jgi:hypothetical protein
VPTYSRCASMSCLLLAALRVVMGLTLPSRKADGNFNVERMTA